MQTSRRRGLPKPFVILCVVLGVLCVAYAAVWVAALVVQQSDEWTRSFAQVDRVRIDAACGDVDVVAERRPDVAVVARRTWSLRRPSDGASLRDGVLTLEHGCDALASIGPSGCSVDFEVRVPRRMVLEVKGTSGDITVRGLRGRTRVRASSGELRAIDVSGPLELRASSGDVTVEGYRGDQVAARANSGDVSVWTRSEPASIEARASSGDVTVAVPGQVPYRVEVSTRSGEETVQVDQSFRAKRRIGARANSGDVKVVRLTDGR